VDFAMSRNFLILVLGVLVFWVSADMVLRDQQSSIRGTVAVPPAPSSAAGPDLPQAEVERGFVADISVHTVQELAIVFDRVEQLLDRPRKAGEMALVSLVLHGPEVDFFVLENYAKYKDIVDRAAKLAALGAVDISICLTQMRNRGIGSNDVPSFLRQIPYGPDEVSRLRGSGYVTM